MALLVLLPRAAPAGIVPAWCLVGADRLLRHGELPTQKEYDKWVADITYHTYVHENIKQFLTGFRYDAHPMSMLAAGVSALSSFYPTAKSIHDPVERDIAFVRLLAKMPTIAAYAYKRSIGQPCALECSTAISSIQRRYSRLLTWPTASIDSGPTTRDVWKMRGTKTA